MASDSLITGAYLNGGSLVEAAIDDYYLYEQAGVGVDENTNIAYVNVYPNPASNVINVSYELLNSDNVSIVLTNALGQVVYSQAVTENNVGRHTLRIDTDAFAAGLYQLNIKTDKKEHVQKVAVVK